MVLSTLTHKETICLTGRVCVVRLPGVPSGHGRTAVWRPGAAGEWRGRGWLEHGQGHEVPQEVSTHQHPCGGQRQVSAPDVGQLVDGQMLLGAFTVTTGMTVGIQVGCF